MHPSRYPLRLAPLALLSLAACGRPQATSKPQEAWNRANNPLILDDEFERGFAQLPLTAQLGTIPWTDTYWPSNFGGINARWNSPAPANFRYQPPSETEARAMTPAQLALLSPAEKYDIYAGDFSYPTWQSERDRVSPRSKAWEGLCHGWAPAALNFAEPKPVLATGPSGIAVPFASSDVKALLTYYEGELSDAESRQVGTRCDIDLVKHPAAARRHPECKGINAGAFHVALANLVGKQHKGFVADVSHGEQIWNQPVYGFNAKVVETRPPSFGAAATAESEVVVQTEMLYTDDVDANWNAQGSTDDSAESVTYDYAVELDSDGRVVGGAWIGQNILDFIWTQARPTFTGYYQDLGELYQQSLAGPVLAPLQAQKQLHPNPEPHSGRRTGRE